jgi:hypothetical protein
MTDFKNRIIRAARLDATLYEEVEADMAAMGQAVGVVVLSSIAAGIGSIGRIGIVGVFTFMVVSLIGWFIWAGLTYVIGTKFLPEPETKSNVGELLRTIGFSSSPGLIRILGIIPGLATIIYWGSEIWMFLAMVVAVRAALDYKSTPRAVVVCLIGWIIQMAIVLLIFMFFR